MLARFFLPALCACLLLTACATVQESAQPPSIGPYRSISARLLVIEPTRRWQVMMDWQMDSPSSGRARLVHAASDTVVELRWQRNDIELRDNRTPRWRRVSPTQLARKGIVVTPFTLSQFLAGQIPPGFRETGPDAWEDRQGHTVIQVNWNAATQRLEISDVRHGRRAMLIILNGKKAKHVTTAMPTRGGHGA